MSYNETVGLDALALWLPGPAQRPGEHGIGHSGLTEASWSPTGGSPASVDMNG